MFRPIVAGLAILSIIAALFLLPAKSVEAGPAFRIISVEAEYGQLVVEAQHFNPDGSHWFFEHYTFQGREAFKFPRVVDAQGRMLMEDGTPAPVRIDRGRSKQFLPQGRSWLRRNLPYLDKDSILSVIQLTHEQRLATGWDRGKQRLTTSPLDSNAADRAGANVLKGRFTSMVSQAFGGDLALFTGPVPPADMTIGVEHGTVSTFYPDQDAETTSVDGSVARSIASETWSTIRSGAGNTSTDSEATNFAMVRSSTTTNQWQLIYRLMFLFDTSALGSGAVVQSGVFEFVSTAKTDQFTESLTLVTSTPASNTALVNADYGQLGTAEQAGDITISSVTADSSTYNTMTLNATGEGNVSTTSITKFGIRITGDADNNEPTWASDNISQVIMAMAEEVLSGDRRPRLVITHLTVTADITGTIGDGATEQEVRDGSGTIIVTLSDDTWVAAGGTFDAQRQAIINGLDAAEAETNGWNAQVRDQMGVTSVVRTSSTVATVTVSAAAVSAYRIDANEVITMTVPNAALVTVGTDVTATPTIAITAAAEAAAVTGTLGGSGGTPSEIVAGSETVIITLSNTVWVDSGATFNAQRQAILDGLESDLSDQNGWDSLAFAVGDVARTSNTVATVTLTAEANYAIPAVETITATVPASALVYGAALTGSPVFAITPAFQASGTRVSAAIDLSSVTDVAYCAVGWEATIPTNTTVAIATSVDGGANFSAATNGSCPTDITVGGSLATVTDFRVRVTLTTTDTSATPLITALGLIIEDTSGQELYYQLNTTPSATLTDRSSNSHTGTMSFPIGVTGSVVTVAIDPLATTRTPLSAAQALSSPDLPSAVTGSATSANLFNQDEVGFTGLPGKDLIDAMAAASDGLPTRFVWFIFLGLTIIGVGGVTIVMSQSMLAAAAAMAATIGFWLAVGNGLMPGWILFVFIAIAGILILVRGSAGGKLPV